MFPVPMMLTCAMTCSFSCGWGACHHGQQTCSYNYFGWDVTVDTAWLDGRELRAWIRLRGVLELLPGVLDAQLRRDADLTEFDYYVLAMLSEALDGTLRMTE